jgi:hypothetical protein
LLIPRNNDKLQLAKLFVGHCPAASSPFQMAFFEQENARQHARRGPGGIDNKGSAVAAFLWEARCLTFLPLEGLRLAE